MISYEDCLAMCGLSSQELAAIAEHEHMPEVAAAALAQYLLHKDRGEEAISRMIADDVRSALDAGDVKHAATLVMALRHFCRGHPAAIAGLQRQG